MNNHKRQKDFKAKVKYHLLQGKTITHNQALRMWRCSRLSSCIHRLRRDDNMKIITTMRKEDGIEFAEYSLAKKPKVNRILAGTYNRH